MIQRHNSAYANLFQSTALEIQYDATREKADVIEAPGGLCGEIYMPPVPTPSE